MSVLDGVTNFCSDIHANYAGFSAPLIANNIKKAKCLQSGNWGFKTRCKNVVQGGGLSLQTCSKKWRVHCTFSSSSDGNGSMAGNFSANDEEYVNSSVIEAVEVRSGVDGFVIKMRDGRHLRCIHNNPQGGKLPDYAPHPAIVLKMEDGSDLLLPIIVLEMPSVLLMAAMRNVQIARPTIYHVIKEMIEKMGYAVQLVRVTKRVHEAYFAQLYLAKGENEKETIIFDLRPSDAINIAVRCKNDHEKIVNLEVLYSGPIRPVPIQVNRNLAYGDGMKVVEPNKLALYTPLNEMLFTELDRPDGQPCLEAEEFNLIRNMLIAAVEERYTDAAQWRDQLNQFRSKRTNRA